MTLFCAFCFAGLPGAIDDHSPFLADAIACNRAKKNDLNDFQNSFFLMPVECERFVYCGLDLSDRTILTRYFSTIRSGWVHIKELVFRLGQSICLFTTQKLLRL